MVSAIILFVNSLINWNLSGGICLLIFCESAVGSFVIGHIRDPIQLDLF